VELIAAAGARECPRKWNAGLRLGTLSRNTIPRKFFEKEEIMRRNGFPALVASALLLAAPAASRAEKGAMRPGQYEMKTEVKMEGVDRAMPPTTSTRCYTEADIKDNKRMAEGGANRDCTTSDVKTTAAGMSWTMSCKNGTKGSGVMTYHADGFEIAMDMQMPGGPGATMRMKSKTTAHRMGDCPR
jgi:hypothetical protein